MNVNKNLTEAINEYKNKGYSFWKESYNVVFGAMSGSPNPEEIIAISWESGKVNVFK